MPVISKLPRWFWPVSWALAFTAGVVNVVGFLGFQHEAITHLTGTTSMLAAALAETNATKVWHFTSAILAFMAGTALSGFIIQNSALKLGRRYAFALILESLMLCVAIPLLRAHSLPGVYLAASACGLQNAMVSTYSGLVVRTTHISGMFTDIGISLGHALRGLKVDRLRLRLCFLVVSGFIVGGTVAALAYRRLEYLTLLIPAGLTAGLSLICVLDVSRNRKNSSKNPELPGQ